MATIPEDDEEQPSRTERLQVTVRSTLGLTQKTNLRMWVSLVTLSVVAVTNPITALAVLAVIAAVVLALDLGKLR